MKDKIDQHSAVIKHKNWEAVMLPPYKINKYRETALEKPWLYEAKLRGFYAVGGGT